MNDLALPIFASYRWALATFALALILFHLVLVWLVPLGKVAWKRVDYAWLSCALLGILAGVGSARQILAEGRVSIAEYRVESSLERVREDVRFGTSGAVCRTFVRSEFSPPPAEFDRLQREFDELCAWFTQAEARLAAGSLSGEAPFTVSDVAGREPPQVTDEWPLDALREDIEKYNDDFEAYRGLQSDADRSRFEVTLTVLGPFLIAVALALRMTKVTGEIRLERGP